MGKKGRAHSRAAAVPLLRDRLCVVAKAPKPIAEQPPQKKEAKIGKGKKRPRPADSSASPRPHASAPPSGAAPYGTLGGPSRAFFAPGKATNKDERLCFFLATGGRLPNPTEPSTGASDAGNGGGGALGSPAIVFVDSGNGGNGATAAAELAAVLKALGVHAFALHDRMPKPQRTELLARFCAAALLGRAAAVVVPDASLHALPPLPPPTPSPTHMSGTGGGGGNGMTGDDGVRVIHYDAPAGVRAGAARSRALQRLRAHPACCCEVHLESGGGYGDSYGGFGGGGSSASGGGGGDVGEVSDLPAVHVPPAVLPRLRARVTTARKLVQLQQQQAARSAASAAASAAAATVGGGKGGGGGDGGGGEAVGAAPQLAALRTKLKLLLCQPLGLASSKVTVPGAVTGGDNMGHAGGSGGSGDGNGGAGSGDGECSGGGGGKSGSEPAILSTKELRKKAAVLGMLSGGGFSAEERCAAETCWLDGRRGADFGGGWPGPVRRGAAAEPAAAALREALERSKAAARAVKAAETAETTVGAAKAAAAAKASKKGAAMAEIAGEAAVAAAAAALPVTTLAEWCPNPEASDEDRWGGRFGKPCGHNEVVMHRLRPFFPLEVLNTRLCSRAAPAPGNAGHDGCLEFFKLACRTGGYAATIWDMDAFHFVDRRGICAPPLDKRRLLAALPLPRLRFLVSNLRRFTVACGGQRPPRALLWSVLWLAALGAGYGGRRKTPGGSAVAADTAAAATAAAVAAASGGRDDGGNDGGGDGDDGGSDGAGDGDEAAAGDKSAGAGTGGDGGGGGGNGGSGAGDGKGGCRSGDGSKHKACRKRARGFKKRRGGRVYKGDEDRGSCGGEGGGGGNGGDDGGGGGSGGAERPGGGGRRPVSFDSLGVRLSAVVLSFVLSGDLAVWAVGAGANDGSGNNSFGGSGSGGSAGRGVGGGSSGGGGSGGRVENRHDSNGAAAASAVGAAGAPAKKKLKFVQRN